MKFIKKYTFLIGLLAFVFISLNATSQELADSNKVLTDTTISKDTAQNNASFKNNFFKRKPKEKKPFIQQFRVSIDMWRLGNTLINPNSNAMYFQADYNTNDKNYYVAEAGYGNGIVDFDFLKYTSKASFIKLGIDRSLLKFKSNRDLDMAYMGFRYGLGFGSRTEATGFIESPFGGAAEFTIPAENFMIHWGEITAGMKMEIVNRVFIGWNGSAKFLLNSGTFKEIKPKFIAGYGKGDKTTNFDINLYLGYALYRTKK